MNVPMFTDFGRASTKALSMPAAFRAASFRKNSWHERCQTMTGKSGASVLSSSRDISPWK
jgi:hypothetical protein